MVYNVPSATQHIFQTGSTQKACINTNGLAWNGDICKYPPAAPATANHIGYPSQETIKQLNNLNA